MKLLRKLRTLFRKEKLDADMADEMRAHLEMQANVNRAHGLSPDDARYAARRSFGGVEQIKEQARDQRGWTWLEQFLQDLSYAFRAMAKAPGFTAVAVLTLALGIGVNTAMFSVIYGVLIDPYPYANSNEIWAPEISDLKTGRAGGFQLGDYLEIAKLPAVASAMATGLGGALTLSGGINPERVDAALVSGTAFDFLGVRPVVGRGIAPGDFKPNGEGEPVCVLSFKLWQRLFAGDSQVIGRTIVLNDQPHVVIGVMPPRFGWYGNGGLWLPLPMTDLQRNVRPIVRFKSGVTREVAEQQLIGWVNEAVKQSPNRMPKDGVKVKFENYLSGTVASGEMRSSLHLLFCAVGFLLLIACTNVANLQLARSATRGREIAVRLALGASRGRLVRQLLTESVGLSLVGGALGAWLAFGLTKVIVLLMPEFYVPNEARVTMNGWVLAFTVGVSVLTGIISGLAPGWQSTRPDLNRALKDGGHSAGGGGQRGARTRNTLVVIEVALSIVLLVGASLTIRGFVELQQIDRGFRPERLLVVRVALAPKRYATLERRVAFERELLERLRALPGVVSAAIGSPPQFDENSGGTVPGQPKIERGIGLSFVSGDYPATLGIALRAGRAFTADEVARGDNVAVINEAAMKLWPVGESPLGRTIQIDALTGGGGGNLPSPRASKEVTVVGIIADARTRNLRRVPPPAFLVPYSLRGSATRTFMVRTQGEPASLLNAVRVQLREMDPEQPLLRPITMDEVMSAETAQPRFNMVLFTSLAGIALALAAAGIYSVLAFGVAQRTREIGVRLALGATRHDILRLIFGAGGRLLAVGLSVGLTASVVLAKIVESQVFAVPLLDPLALAAAAAVLSASALLACYIPARRAMKVDPMVALRCD